MPADGLVVHWLAAPGIRVMGAIVDYDAVGHVGFVLLNREVEDILSLTGEVRRFAINHVWPFISSE